MYVHNGHPLFITFLCHSVPYVLLYDSQVFSSDSCNIPCVSHVLDRLTHPLPFSAAYLFLPLYPLLCPVRVFSFPYISLLISSSIGSTRSTRSSMARNDAAQNDLISPPKVGQPQGERGARGRGGVRGRGHGR